MAEDKKSFILYSDLIHTIKLLSKEDAGELFLHILKYVNDENPVADNKIIDIVFTPIKIQLKRDLEKWSEKKGSFSDAGKESAKARRLSKPQLYVLKFFNNDEAFIKVGITDYSIGRRYSSSGEGGGKVGYKFEIIHQYFEGDGSIGILELEQKVSAKFSQYKYAPEHKFGGHMECYCENKCNEIIQYITSFNIVKQTSTKSTVSVNDNVNVTVNVNDTVTDNVINKERYTRPRDFLIQHNEIEFEDIVAKSMLADFESCIEQWSLAVEGGDFKYSDNKHEDYRKLKAQFQKWINSWRNNLSKIPAKATPTPVVAKIKVPEDFWSRSEYEKYCKENNIESKWD